MAQIIFNNANRLTVTPASDATLAVTIGSKSYSTAWDTDVATTIDNFVASYADALNALGILAVDGNTALLLYGVGGQYFSSLNDVVSASIRIDLGSVTPALTNTNSTNLVITTEGGSVATIVYFDTASRDKDRDRLVFALGAQNLGATVRVSSATVTTVA
jgi:hypothetical protein